MRRSVRPHCPRPPEDVCGRRQLWGEAVPVQGFLNARLIRKTIAQAIPMGQFEQSAERAIKQADLGFGFLYYALARVLKPEHVVVIGSYRGFSVICLALGLVHNRRGRLHFVDAAAVDDFWTDPARVRRHFRSFGVDSRVTLHQMTSKEWLAEARESGAGRPFIDLLLLDGDHSSAGVAFDYRKVGRLVKDGGYICLHDSFVGGFGKTEWEVADFLSTLDVDLFEALTLEIAQGLTIIKKLPRRLIPRARIAGRRKLQASLEQLKHAANANHRKGLLEIETLMLRTLRDTAHFDRTFEVRSRFLAKSNSDLRRRNHALRFENKRLLQQVGRLRANGKPAG